MKTVPSPSRNHADDPSKAILTHLRMFAHIHDDLPAFHAGFLVLTIITAAMLNLGAFGALIVAHMALDIIKYREVHGFSWRYTLEGMFRESLFDLTLLTVGLTFSLYLHHSVLVAGVSGLVRAEVTVLHALTTLVPKIKILHNILKIVSHLQHYLETIHPQMRKGFSGTDRLCMFFLVACALLLVFASTILNVDQNVVHMILLDEMTPWRI